MSLGHSKTKFNGRPGLSHFNEHVCGGLATWLLGVPRVGELSQVMQSRNLLAEVEVVS